MLATLGAAAGSRLRVAVAARVVTAFPRPSSLGRIAPVTAVGLFPPEKRGQAVAGLIVAGPLAFLIGVPVGTWIGQASNWRVPFIVLVDSAWWGW